ncbi:MAG: hypothetical protein LWW95_10715 [Candidatus Desulfofervidus auxilii]|nr:hypothetical protein [Candidatus Desulfofervidus auxilii]
MSEYFLISVSNRWNLNLCIKYSLAGFTNSINGFWAFLDIDVGDYISFLYGARVYNLYRVVEKRAYRNAGNLPPWPPITFKISGKTYYFPFRMYLEKKRVLNEPMVRPEFAYVAENLLLRGGYRKTHFQADTVTFYNVSNMGELFSGVEEKLFISAETFTPRIVFRREMQMVPEKYYFCELILQSLIRRKIRHKYIKNIANIFGLPEDIEYDVLGEKALPEGYVDIFIKNKHPSTHNYKIIIEVKTGNVGKTDIEQVEKYLNEIGPECVGGIIIGKKFPRKILKNPPKNLILIKYRFENLDKNKEYTYRELLEMLKLETISLQPYLNP